MVPDAALDAGDNAVEREIASLLYGAYTLVTCRAPERTDQSWSLHSDSVSYGKALIPNLWVIFFTLKYDEFGLIVSSALRSEFCYDFLNSPLLSELL